MSFVKRTSSIRCDGCKVDIPSGYAALCEGDVDWCPMCAFRLGMIDGNELVRGYPEWHQAGSALFSAFFKPNGDIEFLIPDRKKRRQSTSPLQWKGLGPSKRFAILQRDKFRCRYCGVGPDNAVLHMDHVKPRSEGGSSDADNIVTACSLCNSGKSNRALREKPPSEFCRGLGEVR